MVFPEKISNLKGNQSHSFLNTLQFLMMQRDLNQEIFMPERFKVELQKLVFKSPNEYNVTAT